MSDLQRWKFRAPPLDADTFEDLPGRWHAAILQGSGGIVHEKQCRTFDSEGFLAENQARCGSPTASAGIFASTSVYTIDARGLFTFFSSVLAGIGVGMLIRHELGPP